MYTADWMNAELLFRTEESSYPSESSSSSSPAPSYKINSNY
jgi:hypothetical protein